MFESVVITACIACLQIIWTSLKYSLLTKYKMQDMEFLPSSACAQKLQLHLNYVPDETNCIFSLPPSSDFCMKETQEWRKLQHDPARSIIPGGNSKRREIFMFHFKYPLVYFVVLPWGICTGEYSFLWSDLWNESSFPSEYPCKYFGIWFLNQ